LVVLSTGRGFGGHHSGGRPRKAMSTTDNPGLASQEYEKTQMITSKINGPWGKANQGLRLLAAVNWNAVSKPKICRFISLWNLMWNVSQETELAHVPSAPPPHHTLGETRGCLLCSLPLNSENTQRVPITHASSRTHNAYTGACRKLQEGIGMG
jgi:hypothetical protein